MEYRRRKSSDTWHFMQGCTNWPELSRTWEKDVVVKNRKPPTGEMCDQCLAKQRSGNQVTFKRSKA